MKAMPDAEETLAREVVLGKQLRSIGGNLAGGKDGSERGELGGVLHPGNIRRNRSNRERRLWRLRERRRGWGLGLDGCGLWIK